MFLETRDEIYLEGQMMARIVQALLVCRDFGVLASVLLLIKSISLESR